MPKNSIDKSENKNISVKLEKKSNCTVKLKIGILPEYSKKMHAKAIKEIRKFVSIPGFRKGRVPDSILQQKYHKEIEKEFLDLSTNEALNDAIHQLDIRPFNTKERIRVNVDSLTQQDGGTFTAEFEVYPEIPEIVPKDIEIKKIVPEPVSNDLIDQNIDFFRLRHSNLKEVENRTAKDGDVIDLEIARMEQENAVKQPRIILSKESTEPWIYENVVGANKNSVIENVHPELPKNSREDPYQVKITVLNILEGQIPNADDEFAKKMGYESLSSLRDKIKTQVEQVIQEEIRKAYCIQIEQALIHKIQFDIPLSIKSQEIQKRINEKKDHLKDHEKNSPEKLDLLQKEAEKEADASIRLQFIFSKLIGTENISVTDQEVAKQLSSYLTQHPNQLPPKEHMQQFIAYLREQALIEKLFDFLLSRVQIHETNEPITK